MQRFERLWQLLTMASTVSELARHTQTYTFPVSEPVTLYVQAEHAEVRVARRSQPMAEIIVRLQVAFRWRVATDQDEAGIYIIIKRRPLVGRLARAVISVKVPEHVYIQFKLNDGRVVLENLNSTLHIPPLSGERHVTIEQRGSGE